MMQDFINASTPSQDRSLNYNSVDQATFNLGVEKSSYNSTPASANNVNRVIAPTGMEDAGNQCFPSYFSSSQPHGSNSKYPGSLAGMNDNRGANQMNASSTCNGSNAVNSGKGIGAGAYYNAAISNIFNDASTKYNASNSVNFGQGHNSGVDNVAVINDGSGIYAMSSAFLGQYDRDTPSSLIQNPNLTSSSAMLHPSQTPMPLYATMPSECSMAAGLTEGNEVFPTSAFVNGNDPLLVTPKRTAPSKPKFPLKLMDILSKIECQNTMSWMPDGTCFCILNINELVQNVLAKHFKETKYFSFVSSSLLMILLICGVWFALVIRYLYAHDVLCVMSLLFIFI
jgi:hypothetical protein